MLTTAQINSLLQQAQASGASRATLRAMQHYLLDRAADMDGGTRLRVAQELDTAEASDSIDAFLNVAADVRQEIMQRGAASVAKITDDEWQQLVGTGDNA